MSWVLSVGAGLVGPVAVTLGCLTVRSWQNMRGHLIAAGAILAWSLAWALGLRALVQSPDAVGIVVAAGMTPRLATLGVAGLVLLAVLAVLALLGRLLRRPKDPLVMLTALAWAAAVILPGLVGLDEDLPLSAGLMALGALAVGWLAMGRG